MALEGISLHATQPVQNYMISKYLPPHRHGFGYGLHFFLTFGIGSTAAAASGWVADNYGLRAVFYSMGICFIVSALLAAVLVFRTAKHTRAVAVSQ